MYANKKEEEEEEDDVGYDRIHVLPPQTLSLSAPLQCTLHLNCGVCNLKLKNLIHQAMETIKQWKEG